MYVLWRSPQHWFLKVRAALLKVVLRHCTHETFFFVGELFPGEPTLYVGLYVDNLIYFSRSSAVESHFESSFASRIDVNFERDCVWYCGVDFDWSRLEDGNVSVLLSQHAYIEKLAG